MMGSVESRFAPVGEVALGGVLAEDDFERVRQVMTATTVAGLRMIWADLVEAFGWLMGRSAAFSLEVREAS